VEVGNKRISQAGYAMLDLQNFENYTRYGFGHHRLSMELGQTFGEIKKTPQMGSLLNVIFY
jgi:hypothetical protein